MNKAVLISIQPKWCEIIASGKKTIEVRKTAPKLETLFKCYIYCTKGTFDITLCPELNAPSVKVADKGRGKVIGEFVCDKIETYDYFIKKPLDELIEGEYRHYLTCNELERTCLRAKELENYLNEKDGYGWHISDLKIYDKPKELGEFKKEGYMTEEQWLYALYPNTHCHYAAWAKRFNLARPPQSWCYVEELS